MSSYGSSYVSRYGSARSSISPASTSSLDRSRTPSTYGSLPRTYGSTRTNSEAPTQMRTDAGTSRLSTYGTSGSSNRYTPRGLTTANADRNSERGKSPERGKYTPLETSALRMGSSSRFGGQIARSPISDRTPHVFGISPVSEASPTPFGSDHSPAEPVQVTLVTRSTSPTPPCNSSFLRARRADMDRLDIETVSRPNYKPICTCSESQTDDGKKSASRESRLTGSSTSSSSSAAARGYRGYIRSGDLHSTTKKDDATPLVDKKEVISRVGGLSLARPTDLPLNKTYNFSLNSESRSPASYKDSSSITEDSVRTANTRTPDKDKLGSYHLLSSADSKTNDIKAASGLKTPDLKKKNSSSKLSDVCKSSSKSSINPKDSKLKKSTTTAILLPQVPNKDFRKSVLNMNLNKKEESSSSSDSSSSEEASSSSEDSSDSSNEQESDKKYHTASRTTAQMSSADEVSSISLDRPPKPPSKKDEPKSVVVKTTSTATPMKVKYGLNADNSDVEEPKKTFPLRRFDSGQTDWWASSGSKSQNPAPAPSEPPTTPNNVVESEQNGGKMFKLRKFDSGQLEWWKSSKDLTSLSKSSAKDKAAEKHLKEETSSSSCQKVQKAPSIASLPNSGVSLQVPSSINLDVSDQQPVNNLNKTPSSSSLHKTPSNAVLPRAPSNLSLTNTDSVSSLPVDDASPCLKIGVGRTRSSASLEKQSGSGQQKAGVLARTASSVSLTKSGSLAKTGGISNIPKSCSSANLPKSDSNKSLTPSDLNKDLEKNPQKTPSSTNLAKTSSVSNLAAKPPLSLSRSDSRDVLEAKEHTPGFLRLHKKFINGPGGENSSWRTRKIVRVESGERDWWLSEDEKAEQKPVRPSEALGQVYCGLHTNIDHVMGNQPPPPASFNTPEHSSDDDSSGDESTKEMFPADVEVPAPVHSCDGVAKLDDAALQLYKDGDYGAYLDLESSINEQQEEFESFNSNRKNAIVLRTQLSVRVHAIIEKLLNCEGRELRRALFSLKQIFQEDKDLVHEFVQNDGLACLIKVGSDADQNYQNYILRALGQVMLYVDGMNGVIEHPGALQWLYGLVSSKFRLVVKTALKLLLVFVEYRESNCGLLVKAIKAVDYVHTSRPWSNIMKLMKDYDAADTEILIYAITLINKTLNGLPDQDMYYDQVDALEEQGMENIIRRYMSKQGTDLDLLRQFQIYEAVLSHEDGDDEKAPLRQLDEALRKSLKNRKSLTATVHPDDRRKSRRSLNGSSPPITLTLTPTRIITPPPLSPDILAMNGESEDEEENRTSVKDLTQKLATSLSSPNEENKTSPFGDMKGIISKAKEELAKSQSKVSGGLGSPGSLSSPPLLIEVKKSEADLHWEAIKKSTARPLKLCDLDFEDLGSDEEHDILAPAGVAGGIPPPPPPGPPPPMGSVGLAPGPPPAMMKPPPQPVTSLSNNSAPPNSKTKKTVKLFWKEVRDDPIVATKLGSRILIWDELSPVTIDTQKLEHLFESRAKDLITKKQQEMNKNKEVIILDHKRSNAINIGMTKLPPPRSIKAAILKMDATVMNREGIEKLLTMLPTEEEISKIQEAQSTNSDLPLGSAEQFLLMLASISELSARLKLWAFKLDYENLEKEIAEPLMDLKQGMESLRTNRTFRAILGTLLSIGIFLNGSEVKGFQIEYLAKVPEVKDTVHKHTLLHHLCHMVMEKFPDATDLYSEIGAITRASKVDFDELSANITKMEQECKASFEHLKVISTHDGTTSMKLRMSDFLADCAERIILLDKIHRRVLNKFHKFCLWVGIPLHRVALTKPDELCKVISEFALEYRTTRERVLQQLEKKASHRERNKTRGKMITEVGKMKSQEDRKDAELKQLLGHNGDCKDSMITQGGSLPWRRTKKNTTNHNSLVNGNLTDADDEILETLVKTATKTPVSRAMPRERKRTRNADRKSLVKRSRTRDNLPEGGSVSQ